ncbi:ATP-binding protein [Luteibacter aegosomatis]|uniref:ATP-binding protein n=1 Tax=Luteibacter aegosomatis TaxID=2911537 RepID=UPI001FFA53BE|nr:ATP-binding protein [Luteibacter aegosomatis]UPG86417.1 ATP-binding protein [Luteibacter aegosomatis]
MDLIVAGQPTLIVPVEDTTQIGQARRSATKAALEAGFDEADTGRVALVTTELSTNVLRHAGRGEIHVAIVPGRDTQGVQVVAVDRGPGFDFAVCLTDGHSTAGSRGEGLGAIRRQSQVMDAHADHRGSVVLSRMYPRGTAQADIRFGATQQALAGEPICGDGWAMALSDSAQGVLLVDGLGHGPAAHRAAAACVEAYVADHDGDPVEVMARLNAAMSGTRGGAVAMVRHAGGTLRYCGVGNIAGSLISADASRGLASHPGIMGMATRRMQAFDFPGATGKLLVMHSDGLQSRWSLRDYPGLANRHPAVVTSVLYRDFDRGRDDVTVFAISLEDRA